MSDDVQPDYGDYFEFIRIGDIDKVIKEVERSG